MTITAHLFTDKTLSTGRQDPIYRKWITGTVFNKGAGVLNWINKSVHKKESGAPHLVLLE